MYVYKTALLCLLFVAEMTTIQAQQSRFIIAFKDKAFQTASLADPTTYLSARSIDRRLRYNIPIDSTDLPVTSRYLDSLLKIPTVTVLVASKWLNQVAIQTTDPAALAKINSFSFVKKVSPIAARLNTQAILPTQKLGFISTSSTTARITEATTYYNYGQTAAQVNLHNGSFLHDIGLRGQNMIVGVLDAGFYQYTSLKSFDSVNLNGQVLGTYDFVNREQSVVEDHPHGMECFSIMAGNIPGEFVGTAPKANYYLFRSEDASSEYPIEEHNWVCAAERLDSAGGDVISSSLGYTTFDNPSFNHTYAEMNGNITMAAIGADLAAKKGILVLNAAGNEGNDPWKFISTPADADSILAVGAVNAAGLVGLFSSYGPSSDNQVKPDIASLGVGTFLQAPNNTIASGNGTSYACPNIAGLATCLWQGFPEFKNIFIANTIRRSSSIYNTPNDRIGYGIPDMKKAIMLLLKEFTSTNIQLEGCTPSITWKSKDISGMKYEIERKGANESAFIKVGEQKALGTTFSTQTYQYKDAVPFTQAGAVQYRIRQVIDTAAATFSADYIDSINLSINALCTINQITIAPNPAKHQLSLHITFPEALPELQIHFVNTLGQFIKKVTYNKPVGSVALPLIITELAKGKYFVNVYYKSKKIGSQEFLKLP